MNILLTDTIGSTKKNNIFFHCINTLLPFPN